MPERRTNQGDARNMAHEVEELLKDMFGRFKGGAKVCHLRIMRRLFGLTSVAAEGG